MKSGASATEDRSLVVMGGPYEKYVDPVLADLSKAVAALESKMNALTEEDQTKGAEQRVGQQLEVLKDDLRGKAAKIDLLELDERLKKLTEVLSQKANSADVLALNEQFSKRGVVSGKAKGAEREAHSASNTDAVGRSERRAISIVPVVLLVLAAALVGSVVGGWMQSRRPKASAEVWSVKTDGSQILISRLDVEPTTVALNVAQPLNATGEQRFSSFADAKRYIDTITQTNSSPAPSTTVTPTENKTPEAVTEITVRRGDTLKNLAQQYNVAPEKLMSLNPTIRRWATVRIGQKIVVPTAPTAAPTMTAPPVPVPSYQPSPGSSPPETTEITVAPGDSLNRLSTRYNSTPDRIRELNPQITNWKSILPGQKLVVPAVPNGRG